MSHQHEHPLEWMSERTSVDWLITALVVGGHVAVARIWHHGDILRWISSSQRISVYTAGATVFAIIGGLAAIGLALYQGASGSRSIAVRKNYGDEMRRNWRGLLVVTGVSSVLCVIAIALDRNDSDPENARFIFEAGLVIWSVRFIRLVWLFNGLLAIVDMDASDKPKSIAPDVDPRWTERRKGA